jgi:indole-3-glycerol phosphate synthase
VKDVLAEICADKRERVTRLKRERPLADMEAEARAAPRLRGFHAALGRAGSEGRFGLIAEIKKASPSRGLIRADFDPAALARAYLAGGATCLSVLTEERWFQGGPDKLVAAREAVDLPVLRKDFIVDPWQVAESRAMGADAILLIVAALPMSLAKEIEAAARAWGLDLLVEVHDAAERDAAMAHLQSDLLGINNRNLKTLKVDLETAIELSRDLPERYTVVGESGLRTRADLDRLAASGIRSFLVGESLMSERDVEAATRRLLEG